MPTKAEQTFAQALALHQRGQLGDAERLYRQVLSKDRNHLDALNLLGVLALQTGRNEEAIDLIKRALTRNDRERFIRQAHATFEKMISHEALSGRTVRIFCDDDALDQYRIRARELAAELA